MSASPEMTREVTKVLADTGFQFTFSRGDNGEPFWSLAAFKVADVAEFVKVSLYLSDLWLVVVASGELIGRSPRPEVLINLLKINPTSGVAKVGLFEQQGVGDRVGVYSAIPSISLSAETTRQAIAGVVQTAIQAAKVLGPQNP